MPSPASFGTWLKHRRKALDLTQAELARRVGCATVTIHKIEADGLRPSRPMAEQLAEALEIPPTGRARFLQAARSGTAFAEVSGAPAAGAPAPEAASATTRTHPAAPEHAPDRARAGGGRSGRSAAAA